MTLSEVRTLDNGQFEIQKKSQDDRPFWHLVGAKSGFSYWVYYKEEDAHLGLRSALEWGKYAF